MGDVVFLSSSSSLKQPFVLLAFCCAMHDPCPGITRLTMTLFNPPPITCHHPVTRSTDFQPNPLTGGMVGVWSELS